MLDLLGRLDKAKPRRCGRSQWSFRGLRPPRLWNDLGMSNKRVDTPPQWSDAVIVDLLTSKFHGGSACPLMTAETARW